MTTAATNAPVNQTLRIHAWLTTYAEHVLAALTRTGYHAEAVVYAYVWGEWAQGVAYRSNEEWCAELGLTLKQLRCRLATLGELGLVRVQMTTDRAQGGLRQVQVLVPTDGTVPAEIAGWEGDKKGTGGDKNVTLFRVPTELVENSLSGCYISICVDGTPLALTTYAAYAVPNNIRFVGSNFNCDAALALPAEPVGAPAPPARESKKGTTRRKAGKPKGTVGQADQPPPDWVPAASHVFRKLPLAWAEQDTHYPVIAALHAEWCTRLGKAYAMTVWRYAAWRTALVEAGYTPEQVRSAIPGIAEDPWWLANCTDPHVMFGSNPGKIERFFPQNRASTPDRFGRTQQSTTETFSF